MWTNKRKDGRNFGGCKKKLDTERKLYFHQFFGDDLNDLDYYRRYLLVKAQIAIKPTKALKEEMVLIQEFFLAKQVPHKFNPYEPDNVVMEGERSFENVTLVLQENGISNPKKLTEYEFYSTLIYFQKKYEQMKNNGKG